MHDGIGSSSRRFLSGAAERLSRRFGWLVGMPLATFRFLARTVEVVEREWDDERPLRDELGAGEEPAGVGPAVHRVFRARVERASLSPERLVEIVARDPNVIAPTEVLRFDMDGKRGLAEDSELTVRMAGPWDGEVEVSARSDDGFWLSSSGENAQIGAFGFHARSENGHLVIEIQSWERSASRSFAVLYNFLGIANRMQLHTWAFMLERAAQLAGGAKPERVEAYTRKREEG